MKWNWRFTYSHKGPITKHKGFLEDEDASKGHTDLTLTQEDFDSVTSFAEDVVKLTDLQLNLVLVEGGGEPDKNRFGDKQTKDNPFSSSARYRIYQCTRQSSSSRGIDQESKTKLDHDTNFVSGPFTFSSHEVTFPKQGLE